MGKGRHTLKRGRKQGNRHQKKRRTDEAGWDLDVEGKGRRGNWAHAERKNDMFVQYYRHAFGFSDELWAQFMDHLARDLPTTFRITGHAYFAPLIRDKLAAFFQPKLHNVDLGSELLPNVMQFEPLPWYPSGNGWYLRSPRRALRRIEAMNHFHQFLVNETEVGHTSRQEAVSMLPPIFLKVEPHHKVLDMCAAPGSKTAQLIEALHEGLDQGQVPTGLVVANDVDEQRCYMLVHQVKRISSPCVMMTNYAAQLFPAIQIQQDDGTSSDSTAFFDRILCDVPCSGDGTLRKNFDLWGKWHPGLGTAIHVLQLRIATRAARLLKVGGRMVYSTCSFNPVEDEAVVAELIRRGQGALKVVDMSQELPNFQRSPGITSWKVLDLLHKSKETNEKKYQWYSSFSELPARRQENIRATCFPPSAQELESLHLERCVRVFPHQQDTGGFFITVIEKVAEMPPVPEEETSGNANSTRSGKEDNKAGSEGQQEKREEVQGRVEEGEITAESAKTEPEDTVEELQPPEELEKDEGRKGKEKKKRRRESREEPYLPLSETLLAEWALLKDCFGLRDDFPEKNLMARGDASPRIYFLSSAVADVLWKNTGRLSKVVNTGVRLLVKHAPPGSKCHYRPCQEALPWLFPYMTKRIVTIPFEDLAKLVLEDTLLVNNFTSATQQQLEAIDPGCCVFVCNIPGQEKPMLACGWKARLSAHLLVTKQERRSWAFLFSLSKPEGTPGGAASGNAEDNKEEERKEEQESNAS